MDQTKRQLKQKYGLAHRSTANGFTLIELLVVVAIISLLASVVLASLNSARAKARDAAIKTELDQMVSLLAFNYNDYGNYGNLQPSSGFAGSGTPCSTLGFTGTYAAQMTNICTNIVSLTGNYSSAFYAGNNTDDDADFSIMAWLPYATRFACIGSSGARTFTETGSTWLTPGCAYNP